MELERQLAWLVCEGGWSVRNDHMIGRVAEVQVHASASPFQSSPISNSPHSRTPQRFLTMFKGILPSKRIQSGDFTMVAGPGIEPLLGKENKPDQQSQPTSNAGKSTGKGAAKLSGKQKNGRTKEVEVQKPQAEEDMTEDAFDKLLVSFRSFFGG